MYKTFILQWFFNTPFRALDRAYNASKTVRNIQINYVFYKQKPVLKRSCYNIALYMNTLLEESVFQIYWGLLEFQVSRFILSKIFNIFRTKKNNILINNKWKNLFFNDIEYKHLIEFFNANQMPLETITRKLAWIEAAFYDLHILKHKYLQLSASILYSKENSFNLFYNSATEAIPKGVAYESIGLVPRSISRTFSRFKTELASQSLSLILPEFRLVKYQANASIQYIVCLLLFPWLFSMICKILILQPVLENWWNNAQSQVFINTSQQQQALTRLQEIDELFWLDIVLTNASKKNLQDLSGEIHEKTIELVNIWNRNSIHTILHLFTDVISITCVVFVLTWGKKRLAIFNSWIQELFYSLSDTMKAFFILLFTDLCIGFHSPHGWEMLIAWFLEHLGFAHNKHVISCFVSTFPVILDTVFKYWIFRHLNRISPSIVVTYHTMNE